MKIINKSDYETVKNIGKGGFARVNLVKKDNKKYAMKIIFNFDCKQYLREIDILCRVDHPAIIKLYGYNIYNQDSDKIIMVTEYMKNGSLQKIIQNQKKSGSPVLDITHKCICIYGIAKGMEYCHKINVLHRDLKPDNILLNENLEPCITDFGLSKVTNVEQAIGQSCIVGTSNYQAPEMLEDREVDFYSDVYCFGLIIYFMFSGIVPPVDFYNQDIRESLIQDFHKEIQFLISICCDYDKKERGTFQEIAEYCENLHNLIEDVDTEVYTEYVNRIKNYHSSVEKGMNLDGLSNIKADFAAYIGYSRKMVSFGERFLNIVKKFSSNQAMVTQKRNIYLLRSFPGINEKKFLPKIVKYSKLNHFAILRLKGVALSDEENPTYILKNNISNGSLTDIIQNEKKQQAPSDWTMTKKIITLYGVAKAMVYLHSRNIIVHDLCPNNIFFDWNFYPHITNFEMFIDLDDDSNNNDYFNLDRNCIAPEIAEKMPADEKSDVYSFAIVMYYIFAQDYPFSCLKEQERLNTSKSGYRDFIPDKVPDFFKALIRSCWNQNSDERPSFSEIVPQILEFAEKFDHEKFDNNEFKSYVEKVETQEEHSPYEGDYYNQELDVLFEAKIEETSKKLIEEGEKYQQEAESDEKLIEKAFNCYKKAAENKGSLEGNYHLGLLYKEGFGTLNKCLALAKVNFSLAAESEDQELAQKAKSELENTLQLIDSQPDSEIFTNSEIKQFNGESSKKDVKEEDTSKKDDKEVDKSKADDDVDEKEALMKRYMEGAKQGDAESCNSLACMLYDSNHIENNKEEAFKYFKMAADKGLPKAIYNCANMLFDGDGVQANKEESAKYYKKAADANNSNAMFDYSLMLEKGDGIRANKEEAMAYLLKAVDKKNPNAMCYYGMMLKDGTHGVQQDKQKAADLLKKSSDKKNLDAMFNYANMLEKGDGIEANPKEAAKYFKLMADMGEADGIYHYARMLENGIGVEPNLDEAIRLYKISATKRYQPALKAYRRLRQKK